MKNVVALRKFSVILSTLAILFVLLPTTGKAQQLNKFIVELEGGPAWQTRNNVQIPNNGTATRFSLVDVAGKGPVPAGRMYLTWKISPKHALRVLLAPFQIQETGTVDGPVSFAGATYNNASPVEATYKFNSWRLGYRYRYLNRDKLQLTVGFTAKVRDAKVELSQGTVSSKDTDVGFVPLLHLGADVQLASDWSLIGDLDGLAGGPGRAFDVAVKVGYDVSNNLTVTGGYRTVEGGADVDAVYNFAWLHYVAISAIYRF